ncbi:hypothetical protein [Amycolatopsis sp. NPDC004625]|uniref:hypothetical protein n=1 Tax=Amycolatopsis sp. NPDC004625 TaxID=3154670 RepID=UPI0033A81F77
MHSGEVKLCERCWNPIAADGHHDAWQVRDTVHPLLAPLSCFSHLPDDPACSEGPLALRGDQHGGDEHHHQIPD